MRMSNVPIKTQISFELIKDVKQSRMTIESKINNTCCFWNKIISGIFLFQVLYLNQFVEENS